MRADRVRRHLHLRHLHRLRRLFCRRRRRHDLDFASVLLAPLVALGLWVTRGLWVVGDPLVPRDRSVRRVRWPGLAL